MTAAATASVAAERAIVISRLFDAPRALVWKVWTQPEHIVHTMTPTGWTTTIDECDVRVGGKLRWRMRPPQGHEMAGQFDYTEVIIGQRLVHTEAAQPGNPYKPGSVGTVTFEEQGGKTLVTLRIVFATAEAHAAMEKFGFAKPIAQAFDNTAAYIRSLGAA